MTELLGHCLDHDVLPNKTQLFVAPTERVAVLSFEDDSTCEEALWLLVGSVLNYREVEIKVLNVPESQADKIRDDGGNPSTLSSDLEDDSDSELCYRLSGKMCCGFCNEQFEEEPKLYEHLDTEHNRRPENDQQTGTDGTADKEADGAETEGSEERILQKISTDFQSQAALPEFSPYSSDKDKCEEDTEPAVKIPADVITANVADNKLVTSPALAQDVGKQDQRQKQLVKPKAQKRLSEEGKRALGFSLQAALSFNKRLESQFSSDARLRKD